MSTPHPADCDGKCEECPIANQCSGVRLSQNKIDSICFAGCTLFFILILIAALFIAGSFCK